MTTRAPALWMRSESVLSLKPPNTGVYTMPERLQASVQYSCSAMFGMLMAMRSPALRPSRRSATAQRADSSSSCLRDTP